MIATKLYLDVRRNQDGKPAPLKISISHKRQTAYLSTGIKVIPSSWDPKSLIAKDRALQLTIAQLKLKVDTILLSLQDEGKLDGLTAQGIRDRVKAILSPNESAPTRFLDCFEAFADSRSQPRTKEIYMETHKKILQFDKSASALLFEDVTIGWLDRFDAFLAKTSPKKNARNIHLRNIRAVFNYALREEITLAYPFRKFTITPEPTIKRALSIEQLRSLFDADVPDWQQKYIDFFKMSFLLIGINTEDLLHATGISGGRLEYQRAKTHRPYSIKVEDECRSLIDKYRGSKYLLNILDTYATTSHWTSKVNNKLKDIAKGLGLPRISVYWARHSWATIASELDIPKETIAAALGHSSNTVTDIYINFDRNKIDQANRKVLDYVLYGKRESDMYEMIRQLNEKISGMTKKEDTQIRAVLS